MSKALHSQFDCAEGCSVEAALAVIGGKWKGTILYRLFVDEVLRFNEIRRILPEVPPPGRERIKARTTFWLRPSTVSRTLDEAEPCVPCTAKKAFIMAIAILLGSKATTEPLRRKIW